MQGKGKPIRLSEHARQQLRFRGATEQEVIEAIRTETWETAELGRLECRKDFSFESEWNKNYYDTKQVRPIFVEEHDEVIVVTVYVYYF
ncbi:MAG: hypothetical protein JRJ79_09000 [Deltaproteobacteria bacterium]|nr:hypothetical protein [Deltaproteobacteria bacterium]MBW1793800.1 hypothetical protein [Deltaproteobacteria bacterium]